MERRSRRAMAGSWIGWEAERQGFDVLRLDLESVGGAACLYTSFLPVLAKSVDGDPGMGWVAQSIGRKVDFVWQSMPSLLGVFAKVLFDFLFGIGMKLVFRFGADEMYQR